METHARHVLIGAFVLVAVICGLMLALWLSKVSFDEEFLNIDVVFNETVTGLGKGAAVNFSGIQVGEVRQLSLNKDNPNEVLARVRINADTPINADTKAKLSFTGLTGLALIEMVAGDPKAPPLVAKAGEPRPRIIAETSMISQFMTSGADVVVGVNTALQKVNRLLSEENLERFNAIVGYAENTAAQIGGDQQLITQVTADLRKVLSDIRKTSGDIGQFAKDGSQTLADARAVIAKTEPAAADLQATLAELRQSSETLRQLVQSTSPGLRRLGTQGAPAATELVAELSQLGARLDRIAARIEARPAGFLLERDQPLEYQPQ